MNREDRKEILTIEKIKQEAKVVYLNRKKALIIFCAIMTVIAIFGLIGLFETEYIYTMLAIWLIWLVLLGILAFKILSTLMKIDCDNMKIAIDNLVSCEEGRKTTITSVTRPVGSAMFSLFTTESQFHLNFKCYGTFTIPKGKNYKHSDMFCMEAKGVYNYSVVNDEFYIVSIDKEDILIVYNTKLFELQE